MVSREHSGAATTLLCSGCYGMESYMQRHRKESTASRTLYVVVRSIHFAAHSFQNKWNPIPISSSCMQFHEGWGEIFKSMGSKAEESFNSERLTRLDISLTQCLSSMQSVIVGFFFYLKLFPWITEVGFEHVFISFFLFCSSFWALFTYGCWMFQHLFCSCCSAIFGETCCNIFYLISQVSFVFQSHPL